MDGQPPVFTLDELMLMEDAIKEKGPKELFGHDLMGKTELRTMALKVGLALLESDERKNAKIAMLLTEKECWYLIETVNINAGGMSHTGLELKLKVYRELSKFTAESELQKETTNLPVLKNPEREDINYKKEEEVEDEP